MDKKERKKYDRKENLKFIGFLALMFLVFWLFGSGKLDFIFGNKPQYTISEKLEIIESELEDMKNIKEDTRLELDDYIDILTSFFANDGERTFEEAQTAWEKVDSALNDYFHEE